MAAAAHDALKHITFFCLLRSLHPAGRCWRWLRSSLRSTERASRRARNRSTVNTGRLNPAQHVLCDVSMLLGKCAQRGSPQPCSSSSSRARCCCCCCTAAAAAAEVQRRYNVAVHRKPVYACWIPASISAWSHVPVDMSLSSRNVKRLWFAMRHSYSNQWCFCRRRSAGSSSTLGERGSIIKITISQQSCLITTPSKHYSEPPARHTLAVL